MEISTWGIFWICLFSCIIIINLFDYLTRPFRQKELKAKYENNKENDSK